MIPWIRPSIGEEEIEAAYKVLKSGWMSMGPEVKKFEEELAQYLGAKYVVCVANGTMALMLSYLAIKNLKGFKKTDQLVAFVSDSTFFATAGVPASLGIKVIPVDVSYDYCLSAAEDFIQARKLVDDQNLCAIYSPVHLLGPATDVDNLRDSLLLEHAIIVEDGCQAFGSETDKGMVGSNSEFCAFSFHQAKLVSTIEGGCIATNNKTLKEMLVKVRNHGFWDGYKINDIGTNARMTDLTASIGRVQLKKVNQAIEQRFKIKKIYDTRLSKYPTKIGLFNVPRYMKKAVPGLYAIKVLENNPQALRDFLKSKDIDTRIFFPPLIDQLKNCGLDSVKDFLDSKARRIHKEGLLLPMGNAITEDEATQVCDAIEEFLK